jgi:hypothetical protein
MISEIPAPSKSCSVLWVRRVPQVWTWRLVWIPWLSVAEEQHSPEKQKVYPYWMMLLEVIGVRS